MIVFFVIIGSLIGAGFASGQEIYSFFYKNGIWGLLGILICSLITGFVIYKTLVIIYKNKIFNYKDFLQILINNKNESLIKFMNAIIIFSLLISFYVMISGFGAYINQVFSINNIYASLILAIICYFIFMKNIKGLTKVNEFVVPILIFFIIIIGFFYLLNYGIEPIKNIKNVNFNLKFVYDSLIYCSYNMLLVIPVLSSLKKYLKNQKQIKYISIFCMIIFMLISFIAFLLLAKINVNIDFIEMPAVYSVSNFLPKFNFIYGIIIILSILTTALSSGIGFLENFVKNKQYYPQFVIIVCITSVIISNFGFSKLVNLAFPIFGILGILQIFIILKFKN